MGQTLLSKWAGHRWYLDAFDLSLDVVRLPWFWANAVFNHIPNFWECLIPAPLARLFAVSYQKASYLRLDLWSHAPRGEVYDFPSTHRWFRSCQRCSASPVESIRNLHTAQNTRVRIILVQSATWARENSLHVPSLIFSIKASTCVCYCRFFTYWVFVSPWVHCIFFSNPACCVTT